jgi:hypothetical protein
LAERKYSTNQLILAVLSIAAGVVGIYILPTDNVLWELRPSHAYALMGFVIIFFALAALVLVKEQLAILAIPVWALIQLLLILGDIAFGLFADFSPQEAADYLFFKQPGGGFVPYFLLVILLLIFSSYVFLRARKAPA